MNNLLLVGAGGFLGAISRYVLGSLIRSAFPPPFPHATLVVNILGCLAIGFSFEAFKEHALLPSITLFFVVGFLGAFTTFSAFSFETVELIKRDNLSLAAMNVLLSVMLCLFGVVVGAYLGKAVKL